MRIYTAIKPTAKKAIACAVNFMLGKFTLRKR